LEPALAIKLIAMDVDGVLTDGSFWWGPNGEEWKRFHFADIMGLSRARKAGLKLALISGEDSPLIDRLAAKMQIGDVEKSCKDKAGALRKLAAVHHLALDEICFMGDDVNDLPALEIAGLAAAPADAQPSIRDRCQFVCTAKGGNGAVRELIEMVLSQSASGAVADKG
jgi:3-deoxy-D-manno-octulosonate 8-phosphate phosphatase (KDO 8-P phosphatase)